jgi:hypothetical protein
MISLKSVLLFKIWVTVVLWAAPLLFTPARAYETLGFPPPGPMVFMRLLGAAFTALLVGYVRGLKVLRDGGYPADTVLVGLVSNALACLIIVAYGIAGEYSGWGALAQLYMWGSALATGLVTAGLLATRR